MVEASGSFSCILVDGDGDEYPFAGQLLNSDTAQLDGDPPVLMLRVLDLAACSGDWGGSFVQDEPGETFDVTSLVIDVEGMIQSCDGFEPPVYGRFYQEQGHFTGFMYTGEPSSWNQIGVLGGMCSPGVLMEGIFGLDCSDCPQGTFYLSQDPGPSWSHIFADDFNRPDGILGDPWFLIADSLLINNSRLTSPANQYGRGVYAWNDPVQNVRLNTTLSFNSDIDEGAFQFFIWSQQDSLAYIGKVGLDLLELRSGLPDTVMIEQNLLLDPNDTYSMNIQFNYASSVVALALRDESGVLVDSLSAVGIPGAFSAILLGIDNRDDFSKWIDNAMIEGY